MARRSIWQSLGPGVITGASDDDPSGIATHSQAGAGFGYGLLWTIPVTYPMMVAIQQVSARIGRVTGRGLAANLREHYGPTVCGSVVGLLLLANVINLGADIAAMGAAVQMVFGGKALLHAAALTGLSLGLQIFIPYSRYVRVLRFLTLALFAYVAVIFFVDVDWWRALRGFWLPQLRLSSDQLTMVCAIFGTTISPYLFFWQASEEAEEEEDDPEARPLAETPELAGAEFRRIHIDTLVGMAFSNGVALFIMLATAATLNAHGITHIETATEAAEALRPLAGDGAFLLFALGIIGTGLLAIPVLAGSAAFAVGELAQRPTGLERKPGEARFFYGMLAATTLVGFALNLIDVNPIAALFWAAVINGVVSVPVMAMMMLMSMNRAVMGAFTLPRWLLVLGWLSTALMAAAALGLLL
jgi:NRAMP (natural resistance-associated macrophage protein)-like metal ion transporter